MVFPKAVFCRVFQAAFRMALPVLPYRQPRILSACAQLGGRIRGEKARSVLVVTDKGILRNGLVMPVEAALRENGMGTYHGKVGFDAFSHFKSIVEKKTWLDLPMRYQPYNSPLYEKLLHLFLKQPKNPLPRSGNGAEGFGVKPGNIRPLTTILGRVIMPFR